MMVMALDLGSRLGIVGVVLALFSIAALYLWPDKKWIGWVCLLAAALLLLVWGVEEAKQFMSGGKSLVFSIAVGCLLGGGIGAIVWKSLPSKIAPTAPRPVQGSTEQLTLHYLYKHDFDDTLRLTHPFSLKEAATGKVVNFDAQLYEDFPARSKFLAVYFPHTSPDETYKDAALFAEFYQGFLKNLPESSSAFVGEEMMLSKDLKFSDRVFIYHEDFLTLEQRASLETLYRSKGLSAQFRGFSYLSGKLLARQSSQSAVKQP
jgi:hypothetical protein